MVPLRHGNYGMFRICLVAALLIGASSGAARAESYQLSYVVSDDTGLSTITVELLGNGEQAQNTIAQCQNVTIGDVAQNQLLTDLICDGHEVSASLSATGIEISYAGKLAAALALPAGEHWINNLPILIEDSAR